MTVTTTATSSPAFTYQYRPSAWTTYSYAINQSSTTSNYTGRVDTAPTPEQFERARAAEEERKRKAAEREAEFDAVFEV